MLSRALPFAAAAVLALTLTGCGSDDDGSDTAADSGPTCSYPAGGEAARDVDAPPEEPTESGSVEGTIATSQGDLDITLDADAAPCTVNSFASLAEQGYFDDTDCHRMTGANDLFVLQCGDPTGMGTGGPGYTIPDELSGEETYPAGTIAMANTGQPDTGGSQFFLVYEDSKLPPTYTVFGQVSPDGVKTIQKVAAGGIQPPGDGAPTKPVTITSVELG